MLEQSDKQIQLFVDMLKNSQSLNTCKEIPPILECNLCKNIDHTKDFMCIRFIESLKDNIEIIIKTMGVVIKNAYKNVSYIQFAEMCKEYIMSPTSCVCCIRSLQHIYKSPIYEEEWKSLGAFDCMLMISSKQLVAKWLSDNEISKQFQDDVNTLIVDLSKRSTFLPGSWDERMKPVPKAKTQAAILTSISCIIALKIRENNKFNVSYQRDLSMTVERIMLMRNVGDINLERVIAETLVLFNLYTADKMVINVYYL